MSRAAHPKTSFTGGELSPRLLGRPDIEHFFNGVARMQNYLPLPFGGAEKTPGTIFAEELRDSSEKGRLIPFVFNRRQAYTLLLNDGKIRFFRDRGIISGGTPVAITGITNANPGVVTATAHGLSNGARITLNGIDGMLEVNGVEYQVKNATANTFELGHRDTGANIDTTSFGVFIATSATKLLLHLDSTLADTSDSAHTVSANGNAAISSAQSKFGGASIALDGSGDFLSVPDHADWNMASGKFTWDAWIYLTSVASDFGIMGQAQDGNNYVAFDWSGGSLRFKVASAASILLNIAGAWTPVVNTWYHVAVTRGWNGNANDYALTVNGAVIATGTDADALPDLTGTFRVGLSTDSGTAYLQGYVDEVRVTKGVARWTAAFTPPTAESPIGDDSTVQGIYEVTHTYTESELFDIQTAQAADIMYIVHPSHAPAKLSRNDDDDWTLADVDFIDGPYLDDNTTATTLDPSGTSGSVTVTASATTGINDGQGFLATDVGRLIRYHDGTNWRYLKITARTSTTEVTATVKGSTAMGAHAATTQWALGAWSGTTGYPHAVVFFQGRLWFGGTSNNPQTVWASASGGDYETFTPGTDDDDAFGYSIDTNRVNIIEWLAADKRLVVGTAGEIFTLYSGSSTDPITPTNPPRVDPETSFGTSPVVPQKIGSSLYYVEGDEKTVRELVYGFDINAYRAINRSILSEHITAGGIVEMAYQQSPYGVLWCVRGDGKLATLTREADQQVTAWAEQTPSGSGGAFESVCVIPVDGYDEVWFIVKRTINGSTKRYVEYQANPNQAKDANLEDQILMQSALTYDDSPATTITGLDHLEGQAVAVLADGVVIDGKTVSSGRITLTTAASVVQVGLGVTSQIKLLPVEAASAIGSAQGLRTRFSEILARVYRTAGLTIGKDGGNMEEVLRDGNGNLLTSLQTDDFRVRSTIGWDTKNQLLLEAADPLPCTILMLVLYVWASEK